MLSQRPGGQETVLTWERRWDYLNWECGGWGRNCRKTAIKLLKERKDEWLADGGERGGGCERDGSVRSMHGYRGCNQPVKWDFYTLMRCHRSPTEKQRNASKVCVCVCNVCVYNVCVCMCVCVCVCVQLIYSCYVGNISGILKTRPGSSCSTSNRKNLENPTVVDDDFVCHSPPAHGTVSRWALEGSLGVHHVSPHVSKPSIPSCGHLPHVIPPLNPLCI